MAKLLKLERLAELLIDFESDCHGLPQSVYTVDLQKEEFELLWEKINAAYETLKHSNEEQDLYECERAAYLYSECKLARISFYITMDNVLRNNGSKKTDFAVEKLSSQTEMKKFASNHLKCRNKVHSFSEPGSDMQNRQTCSENKQDRFIAPTTETILLENAKSHTNLRKSKMPIVNEIKNRVVKSLNFSNLEKGLIFEKVNWSVETFDPNTSMSALQEYEVFQERFIPTTLSYQLSICSSNIKRKRSLVRFKYRRKGKGPSSLLVPADGPVSFYRKNVKRPGTPRTKANRPSSSSGCHKSVKNYLFTALRAWNYCNSKAQPVNFVRTAKGPGCSRQQNGGLPSLVHRKV